MRTENGNLDLSYEVNVIRNAANKYKKVNQRTAESKLTIIKNSSLFNFYDIICLTQHELKEDPNL